MAPVSAVLEWRGVGANHRPDVGAEGNATVVCSAQSLATGLGGGDSDRVLSPAALLLPHILQQVYRSYLFIYLYFSLSSDNFVCEDYYVRCDHMPCCAVSIKLCYVGGGYVVTRLKRTGV